MYKRANNDDQHLARMADETLVILAQECSLHPAAMELVLRYYEQMSQFIARKAKRSRLAADVQDAQQNGVFAILEAIAGYNTLESIRPHGCSFRTYLRMVVAARFCDFVKKIHRMERRKRRLEEARCGPRDRKVRCSASLLSDPVKVLVQEEERTRLQCALDRLDDSMRKLWQELASGKKLQLIAREQGVSYDRIKRQRRRLLALLAAWVGEEREG
ncbi:MAG: sigma-70 family RNA polymerase sigma factor [Gemmataceae bacterium]